jgi:bifunctional non-homologous end joining protein LigD
VKPVLVAQMRYTELTRDGIVRHAVFEGLREDKLAQEVTMERPAERR